MSNRIFCGVIFRRRKEMQQRKFQITVGKCITRAQPAGSSVSDRSPGQTLGKGNWSCQKFWQIKWPAVNGIAVSSTWSIQFWSIDHSIWLTIQFPFNLRFSVGYSIYGGSFNWRLASQFMMGHLIYSDDWPFNWRLAIQFTLRHSIANWPFNLRWAIQLSHSVQ